MPCLAHREGSEMYIHPPALGPTSEERKTHQDPPVWVSLEVQSSSGLCSRMPRQDDLGRNWMELAQKARQPLALKICGFAGPDP